jgi:hypothetical protein
LWGRDAVPGRRESPLQRMRVDDHRDIPGSFRIILNDGTVIVGERRGRPDFDHRIIHSTHTLDFGPYNSPYPWGMVSRDQLDTDSAHTEVLRWMGQLNDLCCQADAARLDALYSEQRPREGR